MINYDLITFPRPVSLPTSFNGEINLVPMTEKMKEHFENTTGFSILNTDVKRHIISASGWTKLQDSVGEHYDDGGKTFVFCKHGVGLLHIEDMKPRHLSPGFFTVFDDRIRHAFDILKGPVTLLVVNVSGSLKPSLQYSSFYVK